MAYLVKVDTDICEGCGDCITTCPTELLALVEDGATKYAIYKGDPDECIGCFSCESTCPNGSITITEI